MLTCGCARRPPPGTLGYRPATIPGSKGGQVASVVSLRTFANSSSVPIVVFVDMQQEHLAKPRLLAIPGIDRALDNCRRVLDHSRRIGLPVAFIRMLGESAFFNRATPSLRWIDGFEPYRNEMVFERAGPSCYSSEAFTALVNQSRGGIVLVGFAGESACLSTMIDGFHRNHKVAYLCDASASHALDDMSADDVQRAVSRISALYGDVYETAEWIASTVPRKLGNGRNAGG
ncbi:MAG: isochorismatase family protein [Bradyrhizobium sp.]|nr:isochorismatase family protein [Bradyrhizobium sp.]